MTPEVDPPSLAKPCLVKYLPYSISRRIETSIRDNVVSKNHTESLGSSRRSALILILSGFWGVVVTGIQSGT